LVDRKVILAIVFQDRSAAVNNVAKLGERVSVNIKVIAKGYTSMEALASLRLLSRLLSSSPALSLLTLCFPPAAALSLDFPPLSLATLGAFGSSNVTLGFLSCLFSLPNPSPKSLPSLGVNGALPLLESPVELAELSLSPLLAFTNGFTGCKLVGEGVVRDIAAGVLLGRDEDGRAAGAEEV
jgi:hypothetical protein